MYIGPGAAARDADDTRILDGMHEALQEALAELTGDDTFKDADDPATLLDNLITYAKKMKAGVLTIGTALERLQEQVKELPGE